MICLYDRCPWAKHTHICFWNPCPYKLKPISEEQQQQIKKYKTSGRSKPVAQCHVETGEVYAIFRSAAAAENKTGIPRSGISACINKKQKTAGGYRWRLLREGETYDV